MAHIPKRTTTKATESNPLDEKLQEMNLVRDLFLRVKNKTTTPEDTLLLLKYQERIRNMMLQYKFRPYLSHFQEPNKPLK